MAGHVSSELFPATRTTPLPGGYMGKLLRVDLTSGTCTDVNLPEEPLLRKLWGGQALASYILLRELPLDAKALQPANVIVGLTGPITGNGFTPGGTKLCAVYLSPATHYTLGRGATSGFWGVAIKAAGYDGFIITGASPEPVYLYLHDGQVELRDAGAVWGLGTRATEEALKREVGRPDARVGCIGPAGEHLVHAAMLVNDYNHVAAHGLGAVMGSKKLKAIVAWGTRRPPIRDKAALIEAGRRWRATIEPYTVEQRRYKLDHGGVGNFHNWRSSALPPDLMGNRENNVIQLRPCFQCPRLCPFDMTIGDGDYTGTLGHFNAGGEWMDTFFNLDIKGNDVFYLAERINDLGIECSHYADGAGLAFEAWEKGLLGPDRTGGLELKWGDTTAADRLLEMCARREGWLGNLLADGPKELAQALGGDAPQWVVHTKGGTPAQHEWRPLIGNMLRELVASGGMKPQGGGTNNPPPDLRYREHWGPLDPRTPNGWPHSQVISEQFRQMAGLMGACWFAQGHMKPDGLNSMIDALNATTGWDVTLEEGLVAGHRAMILQSLFGTQRGWRAEHDWTDVGPRFLEPMADGPYEGFTVAEFLPGLIHDYYRESGRHELSGRPFRKTLSELGLEEFEEWAEPA
jgi:aldehyde:ferredoxin oxidoreductase